MATGKKPRPHGSDDVLRTAGDAPNRNRGRRLVASQPAASFERVCLLAIPALLCGTKRSRAAQMQDRFQATAQISETVCRKTRPDRYRRDGCQPPPGNKRLRLLGIDCRTSCG